MKVLIANDGIHAHYFERSGWLKALNTIPGIQCKMYECKKYSPFDIFDSFEPDIFIGQLYNLDEPTLKCIMERPQLRIGLRTGDWGPISSDIQGYANSGVLHSTRSEIELIKRLKDETGQPEFVFTHYSNSNMGGTHGYFEKIGIKPVGIMLAADIFEYYGAKRDDSLVCDVGFVGGYWPNKAININKTLCRLCHEQDQYNIKVFSNAKWPVKQWCGNLDNSKVKNLFYSSCISPNIHEPHSTLYGIDVNERTFKILAAGGFVLSDNVLGQKLLFPEGVQVEYYETYADFSDKIAYYTQVQNRDKRNQIALAGQKEVLENHTYFERVAQVLTEFGYTKEAGQCKEIKKAVIRAIDEQSI